MLSKEFISLWDSFLASFPEPQWQFLDAIRVRSFTTISAEEYDLISKFEFKTETNRVLCKNCCRLPRSPENLTGCELTRSYRGDLICRLSTSEEELYIRRYQIIRDGLSNACKATLYTIWFLKDTFGRGVKDLILIIARKIYETRHDYALWYIPKKPVISIKGRRGRK